MNGGLKSNPAKPVPIEHKQHMFVFDNAAGWVDENPPYSEYPFVVWLANAYGQPANEFWDCETAEYADFILDQIGRLTDGQSDRI